MNISIFDELAEATDQYLSDCARALTTIANDSTTTTEEKIAGIASALRIRPAQAKNVLAGATASTQMPKFHDTVTATGAFHHDTYAALGKKLGDATPSDLHKAEERLMETYSDTPTPTVARINEACVPKEERKAASPAKKSYDPTSADSVREFINAMPSMMMTASSGEAVLGVVINPEHARTVNDILTKTNEQSRYGNDPSSVLTGALLGERIPRIMLHALKIPDGKVYFEGHGWVDESVIAAHPPFLVNKNQLTPQQIAEMLVATPSLHKVKPNGRQ